MLRSNAHKSVMLNSMEDQDALQPEDHPSPLPSGNAALVDHPPAPPPSSSNGGRGTSSLAHMEKMRQEIRQLQEKRAAAMMNEVVELQRERDTAVGRVKIMKQTLEGRPTVQLVISCREGEKHPLHPLATPLPPGLGQNHETDTGRYKVQLGCLGEGQD